MAQRLVLLLDSNKVLGLNLQFACSARDNVGFPPKEYILGHVIILKWPWVRGR